MSLPKTIPTDELCELLGYTARRLHQLADQDYFPKPAAGKWDLGKVVRGLLRYKDEEKSPALERLNEAKLEAQIRKNRIAEKLETRDYMETAEVSGILEIGIKAIELVPAKMSSEFGMTVAQEKRLTQLLDEARSDWAKKIAEK